MNRPAHHAALLFILVSFGAIAQASMQARQAGGAPVRIRILTAGGLLGQDDGMPEYPGGPFDTEVGPGMRPYGGLAGLVDWVRRDTKPRDLFLMTANNLPRDVTSTGGESVIAFFRRVRQLQPSAIAVGVEDFLRGLDGKRIPPTAANAGRVQREAQSASRANARTGGLLVTRMRESGLPFLVTNAAVRLHGPSLNTVLDGGFTLAVDRDRSVGWIRELAVMYPCARRQALAGAEISVARMNAGGQPDDRAAGRYPLRTPAGRTCRATASLPARLRPGASYEIRILTGNTPIATFRIRTDESLTPQTAIVPDRPELPIIVAIVDPHVRNILAAPKWRWRTDAESKCAADECEILLLPPADALDMAIGFAEPAPTARPIALLSQLDDQDTSALLQSNPRIRIVVFPPDSQALGRAAARTDANPRQAAGGARYSGDLGFGAVLNTSTPTAAQIWTRPEWFGESIHAIEADVDPRTWGVTNAEHSSFSVKGHSLCARPTGSGTEVGYFLLDWRIENGATIYQEDPARVPVAKAPYRYAPMSADVPYDAGGRFPQGTLWTSLDSFAAVALDAMRTGFGTDLALLPAGAIDDNWMTYLREDPTAPTRWLSRVLLERLLFRAGTIVRVRLPATSLFNAINSIITSGRAAGERYCLAGIQAAACGSPRLSAQSTFINERRLDRNRYYTIAMPENVALENGLARYGDDDDDLVYLMDRLFAAGEGDAPDTCAAAAQAQPARPAAQGTAAGRLDPLAVRLERTRAAANLPYFIMKPAEFSFTQTQIEEPPDGEGLFNRLAIPNSGARPSRRVSVAFTVDGGIIDTRRWALRAVGTFAYGRAVVNSQSSTDPNTAFTGVRLDWKLPTRGRLFGGLFWETQFNDSSTNVTATRAGISVTLPLVTRKRDYRFVGAGFELEVPQITRWLSIDPLRASAHIGASMSEHVDIHIDGERQGLDQFQRFGAAGLLNRYFATHPGLSSSSVYAFVDEPLRRARVQVDLTPRFALDLGGRGVEVSLATSYRRFVGANVVNLAEKQSTTIRLTIAVPLVGLATLNLNGQAMAAQVHGVEGWFTVLQPSVSVSVPIIGSRRAGWIF